MRLRQEAGASDLLKVQEELLALQADPSICLQRKVEVLSAGSAPRAAVATGAAEAAAENQA